MIRMSLSMTASDDRRPAHLVGSLRDFSQTDLDWIAERFEVSGIREVRPFRERGNINQHTFEVIDVEGSEFLLQRLSTEIFKMPLRVMGAMQEWIGAQTKYIADGSAPEWTVWEPITLIRTRRGEPFLDLSDSSGLSIWRMMKKIGNSVTYKSLSEVADRVKQLELAEEVGRGLALNTDLTSPIRVETLIPSLPGYRDTAGYFNQFFAIADDARGEILNALMPDQEELRAATSYLYHNRLGEKEAEERRSDPELAHFIRLCRSSAEHGLKLQRLQREGVVRRTAIHGDTKIDNFLFCRNTGKVRSLVDLDTIMPYTWLADWGDMMRSLCNVAGEKEHDLDKVQVDREVYEAVTRGFLSTTREVTEAEVDMMSEAVQIIALELGVRFLTDYLRGDDYFMVDLDGGDPLDINKRRAMVQLTLYERLKECDNWSRELIAKYRA